MNYKNSVEFYGNKYFWMDACHLNDIGAKAFTYKLSGDLWKIWKQSGIFNRNKGTG